MTCHQLIRSFVTERLSAAADDIFHVFEKTLLKYEEEASQSQQEIRRLRGLLLDFSGRHHADVSLSSPSWNEEAPSTEQPREQEQLEELIKEEPPERWGGPELTEEKEEIKELLVSERDSQETNQSQRPPERGVPQEPPSGLAELPGSPPVPPQDYSCYLCNQSFSSSHSLNHHTVGQHSNISGVLVCAECGETLESSESFTLHLQSHKKPQSCSMCGKHFSCPTNLSQHVSRHANVKPHRCHVCGRGCRRKGDLKIHMRIHTGEKPYCCSFCSRSFTHSGHLRKHLRSHTGERPHCCHICSRSFLQSIHLKDHLRKHKKMSFPPP